MSLCSRLHTKPFTNHLHLTSISTKPDSIIPFTNVVTESGTPSSRRGCRPDNTSYNTILGRIENFCKLNKPAEAKELFQEMLSRGIKPDCRAYQHLLCGFGSQGNLEEIRKIYDEMNDKGVKPNRFCKKLVMKYLGESALTEKSSIPATASFYHKYIHKLGKKGKVKEMRNVLNEMSEKGFTPCTCCVQDVIVSFICREGDYEAAKEVFKKFYRPHFYFRSTLQFTLGFVKKYISVLENNEVLETIDMLEKVHRILLFYPEEWIGMLCGANKTVVAKALCDKYLSVDGKPNAGICEILIRGFEGEGNSEELRRLFTHMVDVGVDFSRYSCETLIRVLTRSDDFATVLQAYKSCVSKEWAEDVFSSKYFALRPFMDELVNFSDHGRILKAIHMMENKGIQPGFCPYTFAFETVCQLKKPQEAKALLKEMLSMGLKISCKLYYNLICVFIEEKDMTESKELYNEMHESGLKLNDSQHRVLVMKLWQGGDFETAFQALNYCISKGWFIDGVLDSESHDLSENDRKQ